MPCCPAAASPHVVPSVPSVVSHPSSGLSPPPLSWRSLYFSTRWVGVFGSASRNSHSRGTWNLARRSAANARSSSGRHRRARDDERLDLLAEHRVGHADHRRLGDGGMLAERLLDQRRRHVLAAAADDVALAVDEVEPAVGVERAEIAGVEPAVAQCLGGLLGIAEVLGHAVRRADDDLARHRRAAAAALVVDDARSSPPVPPVPPSPCAARRRAASSSPPRRRSSRSTRRRRRRRSG